jgi:hypothetical protein
LRDNSGVTTDCCRLKQVSGKRPLWRSEKADRNSRSMSEIASIVAEGYAFRDQWETAEAEPQLRSARICSHALRLPVQSAPTVTPQSAYPARCHQIAHLIRRQLCDFLFNFHDRPSQRLTRELCSSSCTTVTDKRPVAPERTRRHFEKFPRCKRSAPPNSEQAARPHR